jgi:hypothetical protein
MYACDVTKGHLWICSIWIFMNILVVEGGKSTHKAYINYLDTDEA